MNETRTGAVAPDREEREQRHTDVLAVDEDGVAIARAARELPRLPDVRPDYAPEAASTAGARLIVQFAAGGLRQRVEVTPRARGAQPLGLLSGDADPNADGHLRRPARRGP